MNGVQTRTHLNTTDVLGRYWDRAATVLRNAAFRASVDAAAALIGETYRAGGTIVTVGNGGSASTAGHFAADLAKYATADRGDLKALCLNDSIPLTTAWTNDESWSACYDRSVGTWLGAGGGLLCLFSVHGGGPLNGQEVSGNLTRAAVAAKRYGNQVIAFTGFDGGGIGEAADVHVNVPVDAEPLGTPLIEGMHLVATHAVCLAVRLDVLSAR